MRENKFRAWAVNEKRFLNENEIHELLPFFCGYEICGMNPHTFTLFSNVSDPGDDGDETKVQEIKWIQYIGRKDKNGKEIFEGDVVSDMGSDCSKCPDRVENGNCAPTEGDCPVIEKERDVVTMERFPLFWLKNENFGYEGEDLVSPENCIIIGNIYENPELIGEK